MGCIVSTIINYIQIYNLIFKNIYFCYLINVFEALQYPLYLHSIKTHKGKVYSVMKYFNVFL